MRTLFWRQMWSHLLVAASALFVFAALLPSLFLQHYQRAEQQRAEAAAQSLARVADTLLQSGDTRDVEMLVRASARVLGGGVKLQTPRGEITGGNLLYAPGQARSAARPLAQGGQITVVVPIAAQEQIVRIQRRVASWGAAIAILLAVFLAYFSARAMSQPLIAMAQAAQRLAEGDFAVHIQERGPEEIRSLAASMNDMARRLASLDELRRDFIASASHELRAPLTAIRGFLEALLDGTASTEEQQKHCLHAAAREAQRMTRLVDDLLQLSRLQAGVLSFEMAATDVRGVIEDVVQSFAPRLRAKNVTMQIEAEDVPPVLADGERLAQALVNLLDNALRYSPPGSGIKIRLTSGVSPELSLPSVPAEALVVAVADQGPGLSEADLPRIFERFYKAEAGRQIGEQGAGMGLAIAKEIIERHHGAMFARNRPEGGAEIGFWLPLTLPPEA